MQFVSFPSLYFAGLTIHKFVFEVGPTDEYNRKTKLLLPIGVQRGKCGPAVQLCLCMFFVRMFFCSVFLSLVSPLD